MRARNSGLKTKNDVGECGKWFTLQLVELESSSFPVQKHVLRSSKEIFGEKFFSRSHNSTETSSFVEQVMEFFPVTFFFVSIFSSALGFNGFTTLYNTHEEPPIVSDDYKSSVGLTSKEKWIKQKLDHFNPQDSREWNMRYLENDRFFKPGKED